MKTLIIIKYLKYLIKDIINNAIDIVENLPDQIIELTEKNEYENAYEEDEAEKLPKLNLECLRDDASLLSYNPDISEKTCSRCKNLNGWRQLLFGHWMSPNWSPETCTKCRNMRPEDFDSVSMISTHL